MRIRKILSKYYAYPFYLYLFPLYRQQELTTLLLCCYEVSVIKLCKTTCREA